MASRLPTPRESSAFEGMNISDDVQSYHTLSVKRHSLGATLQNFTEPPLFSSLCDTSPQATNACDNPPLPVVEVSEATTITDEWINAAINSVGNPISCMPSAPPPHTAYPTPSVTYPTPITQTSSCSVDYPRQPRTDDLNNAWYGFK